MHAYKVYFGEDWFDDSFPKRPSPFPILDAAHDVDPPVLAPPKKLLTDEELAAESEETDDNDESMARDDWFAFFRWLGVTPHLRLTPLFDPKSEREYSATADLGRPSERHPALGTLPQSTWSRFQKQLQEAVEKSTAGERDNLSIYRANRLEFWPAIRDAARDDTDVAISLFCHLAYWWEARYSDATTVGVGGHSVSAGQVASRGKGVPNSTERYPLGQNLWLWELREAVWCPSIHGPYQPTRVWQRTESLIEQFTIDQQGTVLLPVLHDRIEELLGRPPNALCQALGIRATIASSDFEPPDAQLVCKLLAKWAETATNTQIEENLTRIQTAYRELALVMPSRQERQPSKMWQESMADLSSTPVICEIASGEYEPREAGKAFYVTSHGERRQIPLSEPPVFVLKENEAGAYGRYFGMEPLLDAVKTELSIPESSVNNDIMEQAKPFLDERADAIRCLLSRDRPSQRETDADILNRFIEEIIFVDELEVIYRLGKHSERSESSFFTKSSDQAGERRTPYIHTPSDGELESVIDTVAKALCEFLDYSNIGDVVLVLQTKSEAECDRKLELLDAPRDLLDATTSPAGIGEISIGLGTIGGFASDETAAVDNDIQIPDEDSSSTDGRSSSEDSDDADRAANSDPAKRLWDPDDLTITLEDGTEIEGAGVDDSLINPPGGTDGSNGGSRTNPSSSPAAGGIREATNQVGREIAYGFECSRLETEAGISDPERFVFHVDDRSHIQRARRGLKSKPVLDWLTKEVGLDWTYPGFDILTIHPDSEEGSPKVDRLIEVKSLMEDGTVSISLNEWYTANKEELREKYHLYVIADLGLDSSGYPFIRTVENPSEILQAQPQEQTSISLEVDTKRFAKGGTVKEVPLRETQ